MPKRAALTSNATAALIGDSKHLNRQNLFENVPGIVAESDRQGAKLQFDKNELRHLITLFDLPLPQLRGLLTDADKYSRGDSGRPLEGRLFVNIFFESSTRTRTAFEAAAKQLGADVVNLDQTTMAGRNKHESLEDTVRTVAAMGACGIALRHSDEYAAVQAARVAAEWNIPLINGGTGCTSHPTQGLTDIYTLREIHKQKDFPNLSVAIIGDVAHSRVARSDLQALKIMGVKNIRLSGPPSLCPESLEEELGVPVYNPIEMALENADAVILLRVQRERLNEKEGGSFAQNACKYFANYGMTKERLALLKPNAVVMHPGPINRGIEIADDVADGPQSRILRQVTNGMAIRKAVLEQLCGTKN